MFQRLRCEAGLRLVQSDSLAHRSRTLTRLFGGAMRTRVLALARGCGQRCEDVLVALESAGARLKVAQISHGLSRNRLETSGSALSTL